MGKKRKSIATSLDEVDRSIYASFCGAANSLSQLYTHAMNQQKLSFQAGGRHGLEKLYQWIRRLQEGGSRVTTVDILNYIQNELDYCGEEPSMSSRAAIPQNSQPSTQFTNSSLLDSSASSGQAGRTSGGQGARSEHSDNQSKNLIFSNALSSPIQQSLQNYHIAQEGHYPAGGSSNGSRNETNFIQNQDRHPNPPSSNDSSMDMHAD